MRPEYSTLQSVIHDPGQGKDGEGRTNPIKRSQLNKLITNLGDGKSSPLYWNPSGRPEIMPLQELRDSYDDNAKRFGNGWTTNDTMNALVYKMKMKQEADGLHSSTL